MIEMAMQPRLLPRAITATLSIRFAPLDLPELARAGRLLHAVIQVAPGSVVRHPELTRSAVLRQHKALGAAIRERRAFGAWSGGCLVGIAIVDGCTLVALAVAPDHQRFGFARGLIRMAMNLVAAAGGCYLDIWCAPSVAKTALRRCGFESVGTDRPLPSAQVFAGRTANGARVTAAARMVKLIPPISAFQTTLRPLLSGDLGVVAAMWHRAFHHAYARLLPPAILCARNETFFHRLCQRLQVGMLVIWIGDEPVGLAVRNGAELDQFYVDPQFHGVGIAQRLMAEVLDTFRQHLIARPHLFCLTGNARALAFYAKCGWQIMGTQSITPYGTPVIDGQPVTVDCHRLEYVAG